MGHGIGLMEYFLMAGALVAFGFVIGFLFGVAVATHGNDFD